MNHYEHRLLKMKDLRVHALDPDGPKFGNFRLFGSCPDPPHRLAFQVLFARTRAVAWPSEFLITICCSERIFKSPYRDRQGHSARRLRCGTRAAIGADHLATAKHRHWPEFVLGGVGESGTSSWAEGEMTPTFWTGDNALSASPKHSFHLRSPFLWWDVHTAIERAE